ncbi:MAG: hypothetical protein U5L11_15725 [Arhodomonas sp.]|nr:hypothetical protein [Arhodomonas sp.]
MGDTRGTGPKHVPHQPAKAGLAERVQAQQPHPQKDEGQGRRHR